MKRCCDSAGWAIPAAFTRRTTRASGVRAAHAGLSRDREFAHAQGSTGISTNLFPAMTLGCGAVAGNSTSDNISPLHLINIKRLAYAVDATPMAAEIDPKTIDRAKSSPRSSAIWRRRAVARSETAPAPAGAAPQPATSDYGFRLRRRRSQRHRAIEENLHRAEDDRDALGARPGQSA